MNGKKRIELSRVHEMIPVNLAIRIAKYPPNSAVIKSMQMR
jgi:hypothetical protein